MRLFLVQGWLSRLVSVVATLGLVAYSLGPMTAFSRDKRIELKPVFEFSPKPWQDWPLVVLTPQANQIHVLSGRTLQVIDRKTRKIVAKADYSHVPCPRGSELYAWLIVPGGREILANYCLSLLLIDGQTFEVMRVLFQSSVQEGVATVRLSRDGLHAAALIQVTNETGTHRRIVFFNTQTWEQEPWRGEQTLPVDAGGIPFNDDARLIVLERSTGSWSDTEGRCGLEVREVSSGKVYSEWWPAKMRSSPGSSVFIVEEPGCPRTPTFIPGRSGLVAAGLGWSIVIWDFEKQEVVRELKSPRPIGEFLVSPDGSLLVANVANDPQDTPDYNQDLIIWDIDSGAVVYESPKVKWGFFDRFLTRSALLKGEMQINGFSQDGKYLLVTKHKRLILYEIIR